MTKRTEALAQNFDADPMTPGESQARRRDSAEQAKKTFRRRAAGAVAVAAATGALLFGLTKSEGGPVDVSKLPEDQRVTLTVGENDSHLPADFAETITNDGTDYRVVMEEIRRQDPDGPGLETGQVVTLPAEQLKPESER